MSTKDLTDEIGRFIVKTARQNGPNSGILCVKSTLEAVQLAFEGIASVMDGESPNGFQFWKDCARKVENLKYNL